MTNLTFNKVGKVYKAEFVINGPTALHVERKDISPLSLEQKSDSTGEYVSVDDWKYALRPTVDTTIVDNVYPKYLRLSCTTPVTLAYIVEG